MIEQAAMARVLRRFGFSKIHETSKVEEFRNGAESVYLKRNTATHRLVIHARHAARLAALMSIPGVVRKKPSSVPYHNANMRSFGERLNTGRSPTRYGFDFDFQSEDSLRSFVSAL